MHNIVDFLKSLYNAERLLELARTLLGSSIGLAGLFAIVFAETGLLIGFFLPGDSLLFSVGFASGATHDAGSLTARTKAAFGSALSAIQSAVSIRPSTGFK